jgi:hypothetical protein
VIDLTERGLSSEEEPPDGVDDIDNDIIDLTCRSVAHEVATSARTSRLTIADNEVIDLT